MSSGSLVDSCCCASEEVIEITKTNFFWRRFKGTLLKFLKNPFQKKKHYPVLNPLVFKLEEPKPHFMDGMLAAYDEIKTQHPYNYNVRQRDITYYAWPIFISGQFAELFIERKSLLVTSVKTSFELPWIS